MLGGDFQLDDWEVVVMHRDHTVTDDSCCRVTWTQYDPANVDRGLDYFKSTVMPRIEAFDGFCSLSLMIDRKTGRGCGTAVFDSRAALEARASSFGRRGAEATSMGGFWARKALMREICLPDPPVL